MRRLKVLVAETQVRSAIPIPVVSTKLEVREIDDTLQVLQELVEGYIEVISGPGWLAYVNEEGKFRDLPPNYPATLLATQAGWNGNGDILCGTVVFMGPPSRAANNTSVTDDLLDLATRTNWLRTT